MEKLVNNRLLKYLNNCSFFSKNHYGFTKGKSTEDILLNVLNQIYKSFHQNKKSTGLFIDFKNAFDLVEHNILLSKMEATGIKGVSLKWFESFPPGREQQVRMGESLSSYRSVKV